MLISILLPTRNRQEWLTRAVASIIAQTHEDWELIVLDNSDEPQQIPADPRIRCYRVPPEKLSRLYDTALRLAQGELCCFIGDDDTFPSQALETAAANIGDANWLVASTEIRNEDGFLIAVRGGTKESVARTLGGEYWLGGAVYWRRSFSDLAGGFDEEFEGAADFDLFLRFIVREEPVVIPDVLYQYTDWAGTDSRQQAQRQQWQSARISQMIRNR